MMRKCRFKPTLMLLGLFALMPIVVRSETIDLQLRWHHQFQFAGYYAAVQQGYYKKAGLDVIIHEGTPQKIPIKEVLAGHAQYGVANSELILDRLKGKPLVVLAAIYQHSPSVLLARKDAGIYSPSDLIGKKVMMLDSYIDADFVAMFNNENIDINKIKIIPSSFDIQDLVTGKVDAFNSYISNEPYFLKQQGVEFTVLQPSAYGVDFYSDMLFTSESELINHPSRVKAFLDASVQGWYYALAHPQEIIALLQNQYHVPKSKEHLEFEADAVSLLILPDLVDIGHINPWRLKHMADTFVQAKMVANNDLLDGFIYTTEIDLDRYLKITRLIAFFVGCIAVTQYIANQSIKRENHQRKLIARKLRQRTKELALHNQILQKINENRSLPMLLNELACQVEALHPEMICSILLCDSDNTLRQAAAPSLPDFFNQAIDGLKIAEGIGSCGTAAYRGQRVIIEDVQQSFYCIAFRELAKQVDIRSCWSQPIKNNQDKVLGVFTVYQLQPSIPHSEEVTLIESYARLAQLGIEKSRADTALLESEQRLRCVLIGSGLGFWDWKIDTHKVEINTSKSEVFQYYYPNITVVTPPWLDFIHPEDREKVWRSIRSVLDGKRTTHQIEYRVPDKDSNNRWILDHANVVQRNAHGKPLRMSGTYTDITKRKLAEQQLRDSEQRLTLCQHYGGIGTWEIDLINNEQIWSSTTRKLFGFFGVSNPTWADFLDIIHPDDFQIVIDATQAHLNYREKYDVEYRIINADNEIRWIRSVGRVDEANTDGKATYFRGIVQDITERKAAEEQVKQLAFYDFLTGLPNRRQLFDRLQHDINLAQREIKQLAVLVLDLDRFKAVNDNLGHKAGDELLKKVAARIKTTLRKIDTAARLGGDEFVVLLPDITHHDDVARVASAIIAELSRPFQLGENDIVSIGTSIGISFYPQDGDNPDILLDNADSALYQAKDQGRGCFVYFSQERLPVHSIEHLPTVIF